MLSGTNNNIICNNNLIETSVDQMELEPAELFPLNPLSEEMAIQIFSNLDSKTLLKEISLVSKDWKRLADDVILFRKKHIYKEIAFGNDKWAQCFVDDVVKDEDNDDEISSLPWNIDLILESQCPIFPGNKIKDTHMLVRLPKTLNGGLTLRSLDELAKKYFEGYNSAYRFILNGLNIDESIQKSYWVLMTKDLLPGSREKSFANQKDMIAKLAEKYLMDYRAPKTLEAAICIFAQYFAYNIRLFTNEPMTYTNCEEKVKADQVAVGGFIPAGLELSDSVLDNNDFGVAALREFS